MRDNWTGDDQTLEKLVRVLTLLSFALSCWTLNRATRPRATCVSSPFIRMVVIEGQRVNNCAFESRLNLGGPTLSARALGRLRRLEDTTEFTPWFHREPRVLIEVSDRDPRAFDLYAGSARIGGEWIDEGRELKRALAMTFLKANRAYADATPFTVEVVADFITRATGRADAIATPSFANVAPSLAGYCASPYRSLAHEASCRAPAPAHDQGPSAWGFRALVAQALAQTFADFPLVDKVRVMAAVRAGVTPPVLEAPASTSARVAATWATKSVRAHAGALQMLVSERTERSVARALRALDVGAPTRWDLTVDLRHTPKWREIARQLLARARFRVRERALVFTPEGEMTLPSGVNAYWAANEVESQKHVMIACQFPPARAAVQIRARQFFARQTCDTLTQSFWD